MLGPWAAAQSIGPHLPTSVDQNGHFLFYLHGGVVTELGDNAVSPAMPEWGAYEYSNILDSLQKRGFHVISEIRKKGTPNGEYVDKITRQIDTLLQLKVKPGNIIVLGASAGWDIGLRVSARLKNRKIRYIVMGGCWPDTYKEYEGMKLYGRFLSIYEATDPHGTCCRIFEPRKNLKSYREVRLNTGLSHGFIYKGGREWVDWVVEWGEGKM